MTDLVRAGCDKDSGYNWVRDRKDSECPDREDKRIEKLKALREMLMKEYGCSKTIANEISAVTKEINLLESE